MKEQLEHFITFSVTQFFKILKYKSIIKINQNLSRNNLPEIKDGSYGINLDEYKSTETHWIAVHINRNNKTYFDTFGVGLIPKEIKKFIGKKNIKTNIYRIQGNGSLMRGYFFIRFIDFMLKVNSLLDYTNLFSPNEYEKNDKIIPKYFQ